LGKAQIEPTCLEFGRGLGWKPEKPIELFRMKYLTIGINDVDLPSGLKQSTCFRHGNDRANIERSLALLAFF
jgi:hypothetical protein